MSQRDDMIDALLDEVESLKAIANELFDMLTHVNDRLQQGLMGDVSGRLTEEIPELLDRVECAVKGK